MSATNTFINWTAVTFTPTSGSPVTITRVSDVKVTGDANMEMFKGDIDVYARVVATPSNTRKVEVTSADVFALASIANGTRGALAAKLADANNGIAVGGGGFSFAVANCIVTGNSSHGPHAKFAEATITFEAFAPDGTTDPFSYTAL